MRQSDLPEESRQRLRQARIDLADYYGAATPDDIEGADTGSYRESRQDRLERPRLSRAALAEA